MTTTLDPIAFIEPHLTIDPRRWPGRRGEYHADCPYCGKPAKKGQTHFTLNADGLCYCQVCGQGSTVRELAKHLGVELPDTLAQRNGSTPETAYDYVDEQGTLLYQSVRYYQPDGKHFYARQPDGAGGWIKSITNPPVRKVLYRLPEVIAAVAEGANVFVVEGEKDADTLRLYGLVATTNILGAGKWSDEYSATLTGASVVLLPDNDPPGRKHMDDVARSLAGKAAHITRVELPGLPDKGDVSDWLQDGRTIAELQQLVSDAPQAAAPARQKGRAVPPKDADEAPPPALGKTVTSLLAEEFDELKWAIPGILPEGAYLLAAKPKLGKTLLALGLSVATACGGRALGHVPVEQGDVLFLGLEDGKRRLQSRIKKILDGADAPEGFYYDTKCPPIDQGGLALIEEWIKAHPKARLVVVDTLKRIRPVQRPNGIYDADYEACAPLQELAERYHITILIIHHTNRSNAVDPLDQISGSNGLLGAVDGALILRRERGQADASIFIVTRDGEEEGDKAIRFDRETTQWVLLGDAEEYRITTERKAIIDAIRAHGEPISPEPLYRAIPIHRRPASQNALQKLLGEMVTAGQVSRVKRGRYWLLNTHITHNTHNTHIPHNTHNDTSEAVPGDCEYGEVGNTHIGAASECAKPAIVSDVSDVSTGDTPAETINGQSVEPLPADLGARGLPERLHQSKRDALVAEYERTIGPLHETLTIEQLAAKVKEAR